MKKRTISFEEIDDRGKLREKPAEERPPDTSGEESAAGSNPAPDQGVVEEIGQSMGITYADDEELRLGGKEAERDQHRWELDPASAEDYVQRMHEHEGGPAMAIRHMNHHPTGVKRS